MLWDRMLTFISMEMIWVNHIRSVGASGEDHELLGLLVEFTHSGLTGRHIGSVFLNAQQLAKHKETKLGREEIEFAINTAKEFEKYITVATEHTDEKRARVNRLR
jgi:hypothetical protein